MGGVHGCVCVSPRLCKMEVVVVFFFFFIFVVVIVAVGQETCVR